MPQKEMLLLPEERSSPTSRSSAISSLTDSSSLAPSGTSQPASPPDDKGQANSQAA